MKTISNEQCAMCNDSQPRKMKDSGIDWIGEIPEGWDISKGKNILFLLEKPKRDEDEVVTCFRDGEVTLRKNRRSEGSLT